MPPLNFTPQLQKLLEALRQRAALDDIERIQSKFQNLERDDYIRQSECSSEMMLVQSAVIHGKTSILYRQVKDITERLFEALTQAKAFADKADTATTRIAAEMNAGKTVEVMKRVNTLSWALYLLMQAMGIDQALTPRGQAGMARNTTGRSSWQLVEELRNTPEYEQNVQYPNQTPEDMLSTIFPSWKHRTQTELDETIRRLQASLSTEERESLRRQVAGATERKAQDSGAGVRDDEEEESRAGEYRSGEQHPASLITVSAMSSGKEEEEAARRERERQKKEKESKEKEPKKDTKPGANVHGLGDRLKNDAASAAHAIPGNGRILKPEPLQRVMEVVTEVKVNAQAAVGELPIVTASLEALKSIPEKTWIVGATEHIPTLLAWGIRFWSGYSLLGMAGAGVIGLAAPILLQTLARNSLGVAPGIINGLEIGTNPLLHTAMWVLYRYYISQEFVGDLFTVGKTAVNTLVGGTADVAGAAGAALMAIQAGLPAGTTFGALVQSQAASLAQILTNHTIVTNMLMAGEMVVLPWLDAKCAAKELARVEEERAAQNRLFREQLRKSYGTGNVSLEQVLAAVDANEEKVKKESRGCASAFFSKLSRFSRWFMQPGHCTLVLRGAFMAAHAFNFYHGITRVESTPILDQKTTEEMLKNMQPTESYKASVNREAQAVASNMYAYLPFMRPAVPPPPSFNTSLPEHHTEMHALYETMKPAADAWSTIFSKQTAELIMNKVDPWALNTWMSFFGITATLLTPLLTHFLRTRKALPVNSSKFLAAMLPQMCMAFGLIMIKKMIASPDLARFIILGKPGATQALVDRQETINMLTDESVTSFVDESVSSFVMIASSFIMSTVAAGSKYLLDRDGFMPDQIAKKVKEEEKKKKKEEKEEKAKGGRGKWGHGEKKKDGDGNVYNFHQENNINVGAINAVNGMVNLGLPGNKLAVATSANAVAEFKDYAAPVLGMVKDTVKGLLPDLLNSKPVLQGFQNRARGELCYGGGDVKDETEDDKENKKAATALLNDPDQDMERMAQLVDVLQYLIHTPLNLDQAAGIAEKVAQLPPDERKKLEENARAKMAAYQDAILSEQDKAKEEDSDNNNNNNNSDEEEEEEEGEEGE